MTKKSDGRQRRDLLSKRAAEENVDQTWDQLEEIYQCHFAIFGEYYKLAKLISDPMTSKHLQNIGATTNLMKGLASDSRFLREETEALHAKHAGRTGVVGDNADDFFTVTMLHQDYATKMSNHQQTLLPIMLELNEHLNYALLGRRNAEIAAAAAQAASAEIVEAAVVH